MAELHSVMGAKRLYAAVSGWIADGTLVSGDRLPLEREFIADHKVSKRTVRLVMIRLSAEGLIRGEHGIGYFVKTFHGPRR